MMTEIDHRQDGLTHLCLSPTAKTELGQKLYIGANRPFTDPNHGWFASIIAFWIWYDGGRSDALRGIHHDNMIRSSLSGLNDLSGNRAAVIEVMRTSILNDSEVSGLLRDSVLPFVAYDILDFESRDDVSIYPLPDREWYVNALEQLRLELKGQ